MIPGPSVCGVDASALIDSVMDPGALGLAHGSGWPAPGRMAPSVDAEVGRVLRRLVLPGGLGSAVAATRLGQAQALLDVRPPMNGRLSSVAWRLRDEISFYDAMYVSRAAAPGQPLVTSDGRLAAAAPRHCEVLHLT